MILGEEMLNGELLQIDGTSGVPIEILATGEIDNYGNIEIGMTTAVGGPIIALGDLKSRGGTTISIADNSNGDGLQVSSDFLNDGIFSIANNLVVNASGYVYGDGRFIIEGDWNCEGRTNIDRAWLRMEGTNAAAITNTLETLEVGELLIDKGGQVE